MKVALIYDEVPDPCLATRLPEDCGAEFEDAQTIQVLLRAIQACGHDAVEVPLGVDFPQRIRKIGPDLVFNIAEGLRGPARESIVPAWLDHLGIAYTGSDGLSLALSLDKALTIFTKIQGANHLTIGVTRYGRPQTMDYSIK